MFWLKKPKNIFTWITFPTFIILSIIGHKEIRYMFPIYIFAPYFIAYLLNMLSFEKIKKSFQFLIIISNLVFLFLTLTFPANSKVGVYKFLYDNKKNISEVYFFGENPYQINNMEPFFYTNFLPKMSEYNESLIINNSFLLASNSFHKLKNNLNLKCELIYSTYPTKIINLNKNWSRLKLNWQIYNCYQN